MNKETDKLEDLEACYVYLFDQSEEFIASGMLERKGEGWYIDGIYHEDMDIPIDRISEVNAQSRWIVIQSDKEDEESSVTEV